LSYITANWGYPWIGIAVLVIAAIHEKGLRSLNRRSLLEHARKRRRKMWLSYAGLAVLALSIVSPLQYWAMQYFWIHMLQHVSVMLAAPALYVAGAPVLPLVHAVPVRLRRKLLRGIFLSPGRHPIRLVGAFLMSPIFAVVLFNVVMVVWMVPGIFNPVMASTDLHIGLMLSTFFISGVLFWFQFIPSAPFRPRLSPFGQAGALLVTNLIMTVIAIILSFFTSVAWYSFGAAMHGMASMPGMSMPVITLNRVADQQIGAAILWVCGDFWCFPALFIAFRRSMVDDNKTDFFSNLIRRHQNMSAEEFQQARAQQVASLNASGETGNSKQDE
jgi:cytochrome c oxidase assembly factor CtaG